MTATDTMREAGRKVLAAATLSADLPALAGSVYEAMDAAKAASIVAVPTPAPTPSPVEQRVTVGDRVQVPVGPWSGYCQPYNEAQLAAGETRSDTIVYLPSKVPCGVVLNHAWPARTCPNGVWGANVVAFGNYWLTTAKAPIPSRAVKAVQALSQPISLAIGGETANFNVLADVILTRAPAQFDTGRTEIDWLLHMSDAAKGWVPKLAPAGTWTDPDGQAWTIALDPDRHDMKVIYVWSAKDKLSGTLAFKSLFDALRGLGLLTGEEFYNGHAVGTEPVRGSGWLCVNDTSATYA